MANNSSYNIQSHYLKIALYFFYKWMLDFLFWKIVRLSKQKTITMINPKLRKKHHFLFFVPNCFVIDCSCCLNKRSSFAILSFSRTGECLLCPHGRIVPLSKIIINLLIAQQQQILHRKCRYHKWYCMLQKQWTSSFSWKVNRYANCVHLKRVL